MKRITYGKFDNMNCIMEDGKPLSKDEVLSRLNAKLDLDERLKELFAKGTVFTAVSAEKSMTIPCCCGESDHTWRLCPLHGRIGS